MSATSPTWITAFLDLPPASYDESVAFWAAVAGAAVSPPRGEHGEFATLLPPAGDPHLRVQRVGEGGPGLHLDLHVADPAAAAVVASGLGATVTGRPDGTEGCVALRSPGGLAFCLVAERLRVPAAPETWPGGHRSLVDQVCLDLPRDRHHAEVGFWRDLTGWQVVPGRLPEFSRLDVPTTQPLRLLLQRLDDLDGGVRAHLDLATDDRAAETRRHLALGARLVAEHDFWTVLADPAGAAYCLTDRAPETRVPASAGAR